MENLRRFESEDNMRQMFVVLVAFVMACSDGAGPAELSDLADTTRTVEAAKVWKVDVYPVTKVIFVGQSFRLNVIVRDTDGRVIANPEIVFSTTDGNIAIVDREGMVSAQALGEATITIRSGSKSARVRITVIGSEDPCYGCWDY